MKRELLISMTTSYLCEALIKLDRSISGVFDNELGVSDLPQIEDISQTLSSEPLKTESITDDSVG